MKSLIYQHTTCRDNNEETTIYILGVPVFKRVFIDTEDKSRRSCGFTTYASDSPVDDEQDTDEDDEQYIILPDGKEKRQ